MEQSGAAFNDSLIRPRPTREYLHVGFPGTILNMIELDRSLHDYLCYSVHDDTRHHVACILLSILNVEMLQKAAPTPSEKFCSFRYVFCF